MCGPLCVCLSNIALCVAVNNALRDPVNERAMHGRRPIACQHVAIVKHQVQRCSDVATTYRVASCVTGLISGLPDISPHCTTHIAIKLPVKSLSLFGSTSLLLIDLRSRNALTYSFICLLIYVVQKHNVHNNELTTHARHSEVK